MTKSKDVQDIQAKLRQELENVNEAIAPPSGFTIATKGKTFTLPTGAQDDGPMECVILDWVSENTYYSGVYNPKELSPPDCFALNRVVADMAPSEGVAKPQAPSCAECQRNEWGSALQGSGKACKNTRRLLVAPYMNSDEKTQPYILLVSPTGLKHFDKYVKTLESHDKHPIQMITSISFDQTSAYPSLRFAHTKEHDQLEVMWAIRENNQAILTQEREGEAKAA